MLAEEQASADLFKPSADDQIKLGRQAAADILKKISRSHRQPGQVVFAPWARDWSVPWGLHEAPGNTASESSTAREVKRIRSAGRPDVHLHRPDQPDQIRGRACRSDRARDSACATGALGEQGRQRSKAISRARIAARPDTCGPNGAIRYLAAEQLLLAEIFAKRRGCGGCQRPWR